MTTALITHPACLGHDPGEWHPECPDRLRAVLGALEAEEFAPLLRETAPRGNTSSSSRSSIRQSMSRRSSRSALPRASACSSMAIPPCRAGSAEAALRAAGAAVAAVDAVMEGWARAAFAAVRPPGHHAEPRRPMGFCLFNNAAVAALWARAAHGLRRVAVVDFDVHHGNGTQAMFADDADLFYGSSHQSPCYPGTGRREETGCCRQRRQRAAAALFRRHGIPGRLGADDPPCARPLRPELLIVSAGFDAHEADPLAQLRVETGDFAWITGELMAAADRHCGGRIVSVLEGGYDLEALAASAAAHVRGLMRAG